MAVPLAAAIAANVATQAIGKGMDYHFQNKLYQQQTDYGALMNRMTAAGITPAAAAQGISQSPSNSMPSFSGAGSTGISDVISAMANMRNAKSQEKRNEVENEFDRLKMFWQPKLWRTEIGESYSRMMKNASESKYFKSLAGYYDESKAALSELRPWNLNQAILTCGNLVATYDEIVSRTHKNEQETKTSQALEGLYKAETDKTYSEKFNIDLEGFAIMWDNDLRAAGINPNQPFFESAKRLAATNPKLFDELMNNFVATLNDVDSRLKSSLGEHYKRNAAIAGGLLWMQNRYLKNMNIRSRTFSNVMSGVGSIIPFAGGSAAAASSIMPYDIISGQTALQRMHNLGLISPY